MIRETAPTDSAGISTATDTYASGVSPLVAYAYRVLSTHRRIVTGVVYGGVSVLGLLGAFLLRFELSMPAEYARTFLAVAPILLLIRLVAARLFRLTTGRWRFVGTADVLRLVGTTAVGSVVFYGVCWLLPISPVVPRSVFLIEWVLTTYLIEAAWISYRTAYERMRRRRNGGGQSTPVLIVGAGEAGNLLVREMVRSSTRFHAVGVVDDDPSKWGTALHGVPIRGATKDIAAIVASSGAAEIVIAVPSATPAELRAIVKSCETTDIPFKVLPGVAAVLAGDVRLNQVRELRIEDLLGRDPVDLDLPELSSEVGGTCVLITGAAGSIGSELARQIAHNRPRELVLLDRAETDLYYLELELRAAYPDLLLSPVICDVSDPAALEHVFRDHKPEAVFHAAAYKHVPMMQTNVRSALWNNVYGSLWVAETAGRHGARKFLLVSTDKAVEPSSIMGATKRLAEMVLIELQGRFPNTAYCAVRFGNVLGSNGSVIPIFQRQIARGAPLTVTHPEATRYFMTIPEAVQLILQASVLPELRGRIAMLEMGEPVRILDLAKNVLRLAPAGSRADPPIVFTGLRPGEKLHEELIAPEEETIPTQLQKVRVIAHGPTGTRALNLLNAWKADIQTAPDSLLQEHLSTLFPSLNGIHEGVAETTAWAHRPRPMQVSAETAD